MNETKKVKILFVEDENLLRSLFSDMLGLDTEFQYEISSAANLTDGLKTVESNRPDVVILTLFCRWKTAKPPPAKKKE